MSKRASTATTPDEAAEEANEATKAYLEHRRAGRAHRGRRAAAPPEHRRFRRHPGARSDDAAARHRRHPGSRDDRRPAGAVPGAGVLAVPGLSSESLDNIAGFVFVKDLVALDQRRRLAADHVAAAAGGHRPRKQARARAAQAVPAPADADRDRRRRIRRHRRPRDDRGPARGDRRRDSRRVRRGVRAGRRRGRRPFRVQRQGGHRRSGPAPRRADRARRVRDGRRLPADAPRPRAGGRRARRHRRPERRGAGGRTAPRAQGPRFAAAEAGSAGAARHEVGIRLVHRPSERRQVDAPQPAGRYRSWRSSPTSRRRRGRGFSASATIQTRRWSFSTRPASTGRCTA